MSAETYSSFNHCNVESTRLNRSMTTMGFGTRTHSRGRLSRKCILLKNGMLAIRPIGGFQIAPASKRCCGAPGSKFSSTLRMKYSSVDAVHCPVVRVRYTCPFGGTTMIEAVMLWNEPNNKSHWDFEIDPEWKTYSEMVKLAAAAVKAEAPRLTRVLGGISPIDEAFMRRMDAQGAIAAVDAIAVHGFPLDWNHWQIDEWPLRLQEIRQAVPGKPLWVSEVGVSTFGAEEVQEFGLRRTAELVIGKAERVHWYSLFDLPRAWPATTRHREAEGSSYYRHFYMGLIREDGAPKRALRHFADYTPELGVCQWIHFEDPRLEEMIHWFDRLGVRRVRTGLSWADSYRPDAERWFDRQMRALERFEVTVTYCFTPEDRGLR